MEAEMRAETEPAAAVKIWFLYIIRCRGGQLYTGISTDVERRFAEHGSGKGAKYLRGKEPLLLLFQQSIGSHSQALKAEAKVKKMPKQAKENIIAKQRVEILVL